MNGPHLPSRAEPLGALSEAYRPSPSGPAPGVEARAVRLIHPVRLRAGASPTADEEGP